MKRCLLLVSLLLPVLITGCARDTDLRALQADTSALSHQSSTQQQTVEARVQQLRDRVEKFEKFQNETRREVARAVATLDELRSQLQRLQGDIQETQHLVQRGPTSNAGASATNPADLETRLRALEQQLRVAPQ